MGSGRANPRGPGLRGAPTGCTFTLVFQVRLFFQKGAPFQHLFHSLVAKFSNNTFHKLMKSELLGPPPRQLGPRGFGGGTSHMLDIRRCAAQMGGFYTKKSVNTGPILTPTKKNPKTRVKFFLKIMAKFRKMGRPIIVWAKASRIAQPTWVDLFSFSIMS